MRSSVKSNHFKTFRDHEKIVEIIIIVKEDGSVTTHKP